MEDFNIGYTSTIQLSKRDLIDLIEKTFPETDGCIAVLTHCVTRNYKTNEKDINQSITSGKLLEV